ncbi:MAG: glycosyltransferase family 2 protein [Planctomycetes bacterium]|nr:glycosyltransferase family 2 protein [Planctomycetota bacterium]
MNAIRLAPDPIPPRAELAPRAARVLVVIVNYRTPELVLDCLDSLEDEVRAHPGTRVVVVENGSGDASAAILAKGIETRGFGAWVELRIEAHNGGFAAGNNVALAPALELPPSERPDWFWLVNPDTIVRPGALRALLEFFDAHADAGLAGSRLEYEDGTQHDSRYRFPTIWSEIDGALRLGFVSRLLRRWEISPPLVLHDHEIGWVAGASLILKRAVLESIGLFDERYFLYYEETDLCLRARDAGHRCWYVPKSRVAHLVGRSSGVTSLREPPKRRPRYWFESRRYYFEKHHGYIYALATDAAFAACFALWRVRRRLQGKPDEDPPHFLGDFLRARFARSSR